MGFNEINIYLSISIKDEHFKICLDNNKASIKDLKSVNENFYKIIYKSKSTDVKWEM